MQKPPPLIVQQVQEVRLVLSVLPDFQSLCHLKSCCFLGSAFSPSARVKKKFGVVKRNGHLPRTRHNRRLASNVSWEPNDNDSAFTDDEWGQKEETKNSDSSAIEDQPSTCKRIKILIRTNKYNFIFHFSSYISYVRLDL